MAINKNHEFEELDGVKCAIVEKNVLAERVDFLKNLLEFNKYTVVVVPGPAPKAVAKAVPKTEEGAEVVIALPVTPAAPAMFTIGVTTLKFNSINAVFGRSLHTQAGHVVTLAYWQQRDPISKDEIPYFVEK
jgi:predicted RNA methylase